MSGASAGGKAEKRMSIERIYQKKSQLEHILLRPDTYIGSIESYNQVCCGPLPIKHLNKVLSKKTICSKCGCMTREWGLTSGK